MSMQTKWPGRGVYPLIRKKMIQYGFLKPGLLDSFIMYNHRRKNFFIISNNRKLLILRSEKAKKALNTVA